MTRAGTFRADLLFRINTVVIALPALRERKEDIAPLARSMVAHLCRQQGRAALELTEPAVATLQEHAWPGNIRELRNTLERALLFCKNDRIDPHTLFLPANSNGVAPKVGTTVTLEELERCHIQAVMLDVNGRVDEAAKRLGIPRSSLYVKLKRYAERSV
jgi:DNA-binding NtrC family response regulator